MDIIISNSSGTPIYEQIEEQIKSLIMTGELAAGDALPSMRILAKDLKISALTVKKAYDILEEDGFTATIHGKGTYVKGQNEALVREEQLRELEKDMERMVDKAKRYGIELSELKQLFDLFIEE